jgi:hypothetical protein
MWREAPPVSEGTAFFMDAFRSANQAIRFLKEQSLLSSPMIIFTFAIQNANTGNANIKQR